MIATNDFAPDLTGMSSVQLRQLMALAAGVHAAREGDVATADALFNISKALPGARSTMRDLTDLHARRAGVSVDELRGRNVRNGLAAARQACWADLRATTNISLARIGAYFDGRDHTTIWFGVRKHQERVA